MSAMPKYLIKATLAKRKEEFRLLLDNKVIVASPSCVMYNSLLVGLKPTRTFEPTCNKAVSAALTDKATLPRRRQTVMSYLRLSLRHGI